MFERFRKFGKWVFISVPSKALGWHIIKHNNLLFLHHYRLLNAPICPYCSSAKMQLDQSSRGVRKKFEIIDKDGQKNISSVDLYLWNCLNPKCLAKELLPKKKPEAKKWAKDMQNSFTAERIELLSNNEYEDYRKYHVYYSRIYYACALCCFVYLIYCIIFTDAPLLRIIPTYLAVISAFLVNGMRRSYRYWQLRNKVIYQEGAFKIWLYEGKWFV
jgi:hypothetical protein